MKEIIGKVSSVEEGIIVVMYRKDTDKGKEFEIVLPIDAQAEFENIRNEMRLEVDDIVHVRYAEHIAPEGVSRIAKKIIFVKRNIPSIGLKGFKH